MGMRKSDIGAVAVILVGAGAAYGLTTLYAQSQRVTDVETFNVEAAQAPSVAVETRVRHAIEVDVRTAPRVIVIGRPHVVTRVRIHRPHRIEIEELRVEADRIKMEELVEAQERIRQVRAMTLELREIEGLEALIMGRERLLGLEALKGLDVLEGLEGLKALESLKGLEGLEHLRVLGDLDDILVDLDGDMTIDMDVLHSCDGDDQHKRKRKRRCKRRHIVIKRPGG